MSQSNKPVEAPAQQVPAATVARLPTYLRALHALVERGVGTTSSTGLAELSGVSSAQLRKDLSFLGSFGTRGVGYNVEALADSMTGVLGLETEHRVMIVGMGNLGQALAHYSGYDSRGFQVVALLDTDPEIIGTEVCGITVESMADIETVVQREKVSFGVVSTPARAAQEAVDDVVQAGVRGILSFAPISLQVPDDVDVQAIDVASELQILAFHKQARELGVAAQTGMA